MPLSGSVASCLSRGPASGPLSPTPAEQPSASHKSRPEAFPRQAAGRPGRAPRHGNGRCSPLLPLGVGEELMGLVHLPCRGPSATSQSVPLHALAELAHCPTSSCCTKGHQAGRKRERAGPAGNASAKMITEPWRPSFFPPPPHSRTRAVTRQGLQLYQPGPQLLSPSAHHAPYRLLSGPLRKQAPWVWPDGNTGAPAPRRGQALLGGGGHRESAGSLLLCASPREHSVGSGLGLQGLGAGLG